MEIIINEFAQGGFYVGSYDDEYDSSTEIRAGWIDIGYAPYQITVQTTKQWSFVCADENGKYRQISEASGYKNGGDVVTLNNYQWIRYIRIELHDNNGISPPQSCILQEIPKWEIGDNGFPTNSYFIDCPEKTIEKPYPYALWRIEDTENDGYPTNKLLNNISLLGSFANAKNLQRVSIPQSVKRIGKYAFRNTQLTSVTIAKDCEYYDTSFPDNCKIKFY